MIRCSRCGKELDERRGLVHTDEQGERRIICEDCFKAAVGVDYKTFQLRRENAKQGCLATLVCLFATAYAFMEYGALYGVGGIILTGLVYYFSVKVK